MVARRRRSGKGKGKKCARPGPVTRNAFFNFLREFRKCNCGKSVVEIAIEGGKLWKCMSTAQKSKYIKQACSAPKSKRRRRRRTRKSIC